MSIAEDSRLLGDNSYGRMGRPDLITRIVFAIKNLDYTQLYRRQPMKGIAGAFRKVFAHELSLVGYKMKFICISRYCARTDSLSFYLRFYVWKLLRPDQNLAKVLTVVDLIAYGVSSTVGVRFRVFNPSSDVHLSVNMSNSSFIGRYLRCHWFSHGYCWPSCSIVIFLRRISIFLLCALLR